MPRTTRTRSNAVRMSSLEKQIEACKERIAKERDHLRELIGEANSIADNCDVAVETLDTARRDLVRAADELSQYL